MENKRNKVEQEIKMEDGSIKRIFHRKLNSTRGDHKEWWNAMNKTANPNSKRQKKLNPILVEDESSTIPKNLKN